MPHYTMSFVIGALLCSLPQVFSATTQCRCFPGDSCWPSTQTFQDFNRTVSGRLIATTPLAAPCHNSHYASYDATKCQQFQSEWIWPQVHYNSSSSVMAPLFANRSCDPFDGKNAQCVLGTYVSYAVNITAAGDVAKTLDFAQKHNIRVVIRNTGHDYNGKSTGAGAIGIWTHNLKNISISDYKSSYYTGKAMRMGAGVQGFEAYAAALKQNLVVVGGECPTVGLAGGYSQGGGHSALSSRLGMGADQVLEWEVVDARGRHLIANRTQNTDLYWALSGGGGGTYGVVLSALVKAHRDMPTAAANLTFQTAGVSPDAFWQAAGAFNALLPSLSDQGVTSLVLITNTSFSLVPAIAPNMTSQRLGQLLQPFFRKLHGLGIPYNKTIAQFPHYLDAFYATYPPIPVGVTQMGSRLIPRATVEANNTALTRAYREIVARGGSVDIVALNVSRAVVGDDVDNALNPVWRTAAAHTVLSTPWSFTAPWAEMLANADKMTRELVPLLKALTPGSGAYVNENDFQDPDWKQDLYGVNYDRLLGIKNKYDPDHLFYALTAVGSDYWKPQADGRLCKA